MEVFQEYPHRGQCAPEMKRLSLLGSLPFSTHWYLGELIIKAEVKKRPCPNETSLEVAGPWQVTEEELLFTARAVTPGLG